MERTIKKVKVKSGSPLVGLYFIEFRLKGNRQEYVRCGHIKSMIKENYWYLVLYYDNNIREVSNLSDMRNWKFYNDYETLEQEVRHWSK